MAGIMEPSLRKDDICLLFVLLIALGNLFALFDSSGKRLQHVRGAGLFKHRLHVSRRSPRRPCNGPNLLFIMCSVCYYLYIYEQGKLSQNVRLVVVC
jgi:hypothetical protein